MGWAGVLVPEEYGGVGFGHVGAGLIAEEIGRNLSATPLAVDRCARRDGVAEGRFGSAESRRCCRPVAAGDLAARTGRRRAQPSFAVHSCYSRHRQRRQVQTEWQEGACARRTCRRSADRVGAYLRRCREPRRHHAVPGRSQGGRRDDHARQSSSTAATRRSLNCGTSRCLPTMCWAQLDKGAQFSMRCSMQDARCWRRNCWVCAEESFERTLGYLRERDQFGVKIGTFQATAASCGAFVLRDRTGAFRGPACIAGAGCTGSECAANLICLAKAKASEVARLATNEAVQMHGGIGMTDEFDIGFFMKRARAAGGDIRRRVLPHGSIRAARWLLIGLPDAAAALSALPAGLGELSHRHLRRR